MPEYGGYNPYSSYGGDTGGGGGGADKEYMPTASQKRAHASFIKSRNEAKAKAAADKAAKAAAANAAAIKQRQQDDSAGSNKSGGHKLQNQLDKLIAEGKGDTTQARDLQNYMNRVEQKYQAEGRSLYPDRPAPTTEEQYEQAAFGLSEWEKIQKLAGMEAGDPFDPENKYVKSFSGQEFLKGWKGYDKEELKKEWINKFGLPSIISTPTSYSDLYGSDPTKTTVRTDEFGNKLGGKYIFSGLGRSLMDQLEGATSRGLPSGFDYGAAKSGYWSNRATQESARQGPPPWRGYGARGGGGGGGGGYGYGPQPGPNPQEMANFYTSQANLQQAMIGQHMRKSRGGIVSLLRLRS